MGQGGDLLLSGGTTATDLFRYNMIITWHAWLRFPVADGGRMMTDPAERLADQELYRHVFALLQEVIQQSEPRSNNDVVSRALIFFLLRVANTWQSIKTLQENAPHQEGFLVDAGVLLRAMFDAYLQAEYVVQDPARQHERATEYLDYEHVERYRAQGVLDLDHPIAEKLRCSPERPEGENRVRTEYERVKDKYLVGQRKSGGNKKRDQNVRKTWYPGDLAAIARGLGKEAEYRFFVATFHGCVHSGAFAIRLGPPIRSNTVVHFASTIAARVARLNARHNRVDLGDVQRQLLERLCKDYGDAFRAAVP
jgi:hypothetical protein